MRENKSEGGAGFAGILRAHGERYPLMQAQDGVKLAYQNEFGGGHLAEQGPALAMLRREMEGLGPERERVWFEPIGNGFSRMHLSCLGGDEASPETLSLFFVRSASPKVGDAGGFSEKLQILREVSAGQGMPFTAGALEEYLLSYRAAGCPMVRHSQAYRRAYHPAYRVVREEYGKFYPLFRAADRLLRQKGRAVLAIDGNSGSGKSSLARLLQGIYGCPIIHMDDFFLRPEQRTEERLAEVGGFVDYERFAQEVAPSLGSGAFAYQRYDCAKGALGEWVQVPASRLTVVEGVYSLHGKLGYAPDLSVFLYTGKGTQEERILRRNGETMLHRFQTEWIPREDAYFAGMGVKERAGLILCGEE